MSTIASRTAPSDVSTLAICLSNSKDIVVIWLNTKLVQTDVTYHGPCITELHYSVAPAGHHAPNPRVGGGYHVSSDAARLRSPGHPGLGEPPGAELVVQYVDHGLLPRCRAGNSQSVWSPENLQHESRLSVYQSGVHTGLCPDLRKKSRRRWRRLEKVVAKGSGQKIRRRNGLRYQVARLSLRNRSFCPNSSAAS